MLYVEARLSRASRWKARFLSEDASWGDGKREESSVPDVKPHTCRITSGSKPPIDWPRVLLLSTDSELSNDLGVSCIGRRVATFLG